MRSYQSIDRERQQDTYDAVGGGICLILVAAFCFLLALVVLGFLVWLIYQNGIHL